MLVWVSSSVSKQNWPLNLCFICMTKNLSIFCVFFALNPKPFGLCSSQLPVEISGKLIKQQHQHMQWSLLTKKCAPGTCSYLTCIQWEILLLNFYHKSTMLTVAAYFQRILLFFFDVLNYIRFNWIQTKGRLISHQSTFLFWWFVWRFFCYPKCTLISINCYQ